MATVEIYTLQTIGHNSGDVVAEETLVTYEAGALFDEAAWWEEHFPGIGWAAALQRAGEVLLNRALREARRR